MNNNTMNKCNRYNLVDSSHYQSNGNMRNELVQVPFQM